MSGWEGEVPATATLLARYDLVGRRVDGEWRWQKGALFWMEEEVCIFLVNH